jgi:hypothetical protein
MARDYVHKLMGSRPQAGTLYVNNFREKERTVRCRKTDNPVSYIRPGCRAAESAAAAAAPTKAA